jgi:uncharacterized protein
VHQRVRKGGSIVGRLILVVFVTAAGAFPQEEMSWTQVKCQVQQIRAKRNPLPSATDPQSILMESIRYCDYQAAAKLIGSGLDLNFEDKIGRSPLALAIDFGENTVLRALLQHGANPNRTSRKEPGSTILMGAALTGNAEGAKLLLDYGAEPDKRDIYRGTALMYAAERGNAEIVKLLLTHGARPRLRDKFGHTA